MFKLTLNSLLARKIRLALTTFAVVLGVSFVSGSFILADSLRAVFDKIAVEIAGPDWIQVGPKLKPSWATLGQVGAKLAQVGTKLGQVGTKLGPSWVQVKAI